jgi:S1-C subfamily serine protease
MSTAVFSLSICPRCGASVPRGPRFCGECGQDLLSEVAAVAEPPSRGGGSNLGRLTLGLAIAATALVLGSFLLALLAYRGQHGLGEDERAAWQSEVAALDRRLAEVRRDVSALRVQGARLSGRVRGAEDEAKQANRGVAPLAERALRSVFTVETDVALGAGFAGWREGGVLYLVTANHVVEDAPSPFVTVTRKGGSWSGEIVRNDAKNDLALIRVSGHPPGAEPLWENSKTVTPSPGDQLILIGSPFGLSGSVTTGIVSRVTKRLIQTDAAANPGNSGGPAIDRRGRIVGVLVAGGGQNINFAVRIDRACIKLREC